MRVYVKLIATYRDFYLRELEEPERATIHVDELASKIAFWYEKMRKIVDWKEEHLVRRGAIERILKRVLLSEMAGLSVIPDINVAETAESSESRFLNGRTAMFLDSRRGTPTARAVEGLDWDVAALPTGVEPAGILHSDAYCMAAATEDKDAAWTFIEYANSPQGQAIVAESGRTVPSLIEVASSDAFLDPSVAPANSAVWLETVDSLRTVPVMAAWVDIEELTGDELERAFYGQAPVDEVIDSMITRTAPFFAGEEG